MNMRLRPLHCLSLLVLISACSTTPNASSPSATKDAKPVKEVALDAQPQPDIWFKGKPEQAFVAAKAQNKLVFLYWGAVWCPPCNELKAEVFAKPRFAELMQGFVPVYLDGDTEEAQIWGDRLSISGYPTLLVLATDGKELLRLNASFNEAEFALALQPVLKENGNFSEALVRLEQGKAKQDDWRLLATTSWDQLPAEKFNAARLLIAAKRAADRCPPQLARERAIFAANFLNLVSAEELEAESASTASDAKDEIQRYFDLVFANSASVQATRSFVNNNSEQVLHFLYGKSKVGLGYPELKKRWLKAANMIAANTGNSVDTRLAALVPALEFQKFEKPEGPIPPALKAQVQKAVTQADQSAKTPFERHAVIARAGQMLRQVGDFAGARKLLIAEAGLSDTPWYYYSSLSALEQELKNSQAAQIWAAKARQTAQGRATKIQWITSDLLLNAGMKGPEQKVQVLNLTKEFYEATTNLKDGFSGRNWARAERVRESLKDWQKEADFVSIFSNYEKRCKQLLDKDSQNNCQKHFALLKD